MKLTLKQCSFQSTLPARGATDRVELKDRAFLFQSTLPARGATLELLKTAVYQSFQSTLPARGATLLEGNPGKQKLFQSTLPARGATYLLTRMVVSPLISIHAPRTGSDTACWATAPSRSNFNPRSPHGERPGESSISSQLSQFQSTLPARGATLLVNGLWHDQIFQSTLPARGATTFVVHAQKSNISIHAPRTGSDALYFPRIAFARYFNPRSPHGERPSGQPEPPAASNFNPRSPHGERRSARTSPDVTFPFQPTLPARGATRMLDNQIARTFISTHAPRTGSDDGRRRTSAAAKDFNPRSPHGERRHTRTQTASPKTISTHAPRTGSDGIKHGKRFGQRAFQPTLPARGATPPIRGFVKALAFQPTLPARGATRRQQLIYHRLCISTHAPRTGSDSFARRFRATRSKFQPTLPARGATRLAACRVSGSTISTHAPRTGSDTTNCIVEISTTHFNPRSPHGERRGLLLVRWDIPSFQPTLPARGATTRRKAI